MYGNKAAVKFQDKNGEKVMYCVHCGKEIDKDVKFCPRCGTEVHPSAPTTTTEVAYTAVEDKPPKVWTVFSIIGKVLGIVCLCTSVIPYLNYFSFIFAIAGIVLSCLGRKARTAEADKNCSLGLKLSIAAVVVSLVLMIVYTICFIDLFGAILYKNYY